MTSFTRSVINSVDQSCRIHSVPALLEQLREVIIFGYGACGKRGYSFFKDNGIQPIAFFDSDTTKHGTSHEGVPVTKIDPELARDTPVEYVQRGQEISPKP